MPAKLVVIAGADQGADLWIEDEVSRLGHDAVCALRVSDDDVPAHVATLEYREGAYVLHNRCDDELFLEGKPLPPRAQARWNANKDLSLHGGVVLRLTIEGDPRPMKRQAAPQPYEYPEIPADPGQPGAALLEDDAPAPAVDSQRSKKMTQTIVIVLCALLGVYMLFFDTPGSDTVDAARDPRKDFQQAVDALAKDEDPQSRRLRELLQDARVAELRGDQPSAQALYGKVRDRILVLRNSEDGSLREDYKKVWDFVKGRLKPLTVEEP
jgi:hypothetical protein